jgi:mannose-1-phosphate guanylyltransferase
MQALILVGGEGTRLRPLTDTVPKPVIPLAGRPLLSYMIDWLRVHGVDEIVLACGFKADRVREVLGEGGSPRLRYVEEPEPLGTAGAIRFAAESLSAPFLALNGDVLADLDLGALVDFHRERGARATLGLYPVQDSTGYGLVRCEGDGGVLEFTEKPEPPRPGAINAGAYVLEREVLELIPEGRMVSIEREVFPQMIGGGLYALPLEGYWMDLGTPDRYLQATWDILERRVHTVLEEGLDGDGRLVADDVDLDGDAVIEGPALVEDACRIDAQAVVGPRAAIGPDCEVGAGATVISSVLLAGCQVGDGASVRGSIVSPGVEIAAGAEVGPGSVIGAGQKVGA